MTVKGPWSTRELRYLRDHANEGAAQVAHDLDRSISSVQSQAHDQGLSLRRRWQCPRCGRMTYQPLIKLKGWCRSCVREVRRAEIAEQARDMREEARRADAERRERQRIYSMKSRAKRKLGEIEANSKAKQQVEKGEES